MMHVVLHVAADVGKLKIDCPVGQGTGNHARTIACVAVVGEGKPAVVEVEHGDGMVVLCWIVRNSFLLNLVPQCVSTRSDAQRNLRWVFVMELRLRRRE